MHHDYHDITSRISDPPQWWDEHAVPRFDTFTPGDVANIYADEVALVEIACQSCGRHFLVAFASDRFRALLRHERFGEPMTDTPLADAIRRGVIHYGDPPNVGCCAAGASMNCDDLRVCEYWRRGGALGLEWQRDSALEVQLDSIYGSPESEE